MGRKNAELGTQAKPVTAHSSDEFLGAINIPKNFSVLSKVILRDLNGKQSSPTFSKYTKDDIAKYLENPYKYRKELRKAVVYIYGASSHFRRLIQYFTSLSDLSYIVSPSGVAPKKKSKNIVGNDYRKVLDAMNAMSIKTQFPKILTVCLREDTFYGTMWVSEENITIQQLPFDHCEISSIEGNVANVTFDFSYFDANQEYLPLYPKEFSVKYELYKKNRTTMKYQGLDCPTSFAVKCNNDILDYAMPPFAGLLREVYDIEDYRSLKLTKTELENYAILVMKLAMAQDGSWAMDLGKAKEFWQNLDSVLPEEIGSVLSPMSIDKISFERSHTGDTDTISEAEQNLFSAAGVSSLLFNNTKASANALLLSIKADQALTFGIVKSIEDVVNRYIRSTTYGKNFKVTFLDVSAYNRKEMADLYIKAAQFGLPTVSMYAATVGLGQAELDSMNFLEDDVLGIKEKFMPLKSSSTQSAASSGDAGAPTKSDDELTEAGEATRELS